MINNRRRARTATGFLLSTTKLSARCERNLQGEFNAAGSWSETSGI